MDVIERVGGDGAGGGGSIGGGVVGDPGTPEALGAYWVHGIATCGDSGQV